MSLLYLKFFSYKFCCFSHIVHKFCVLCFPLLCVHTHTRVLEKLLGKLNCLFWCRTLHLYTYIYIWVLWKLNRKYEYGKPQFQTRFMSVLNIPYMHGFQIFFCNLFKNIYLKITVMESEEEGEGQGVCFVLWFLPLLFPRWLQFEAKKQQLPLCLSHGWQGCQ